MLQLLTTTMLWCSALGCGLMAGVYFAFSTFIMGAFSRLAPAAGISAMTAINVDILKSLFMPIFLGTTLTSAALVVLSIIDWDGPAAPATLAGGILYVLGMFVVTMVFNVPLNDALVNSDPASEAAATLWQNYLRDWTWWNHVRTWACLGASALFTYALVTK